MSGVQLRGAIKRFGSTDVIRGIDLDLEEGAFGVFVGPSGCGKSTLLRLIAGLDKLSEGQVLIGGRDVTDVAAVDRGIAMVFQSYALYPHMTVGENMGFGLKMGGAPKEEVQRKVGDAAEVLQLSALLDRKPAALSGGQRQRVAIGRAIVRNPKVFLFDEPLSNLDAELRVDMRLQIAKLHQQIGATMIYVTHDQVEAMTLADKIFVLRAGILEQAGSPLDLYHKPGNQFVGGFIGSPKMNFVPVQYVGQAAGQATLKLPDGQILELAADTAGLQENDTLVLGLRPQDISPDSGQPFAMEIEVVEQLGANTLAYGKSFSQSNFVAELPGSALTVGEQISMSFDPGKAQLFGPTGLSLRG
ncbi:MAG: ABC transporter ATP-binding protein [Granulosicoccaceae bacterium]